MDRVDQQRVEQFLGKWLGSEGNERANYQGFFLDLCVAIGVEGPPPKGSAAGDPYCFDKDIKFYSGEKTAPSTKFADFYKEGCFLIEAKQGSEKSRKGHGSTERMLTVFYERSLIGLNFNFYDQMLAAFNTVNL